MGSVFALVVLGLTALVLAGAAWSLVCNERCYAQRCWLIDLWADNESFFDAGYTAFRAVAYDAHWKRLCSFRDPLDLYPDPLRAAAIKAGGLP